MSRLSYLESKIVDLAAAKRKVSAWQARGEKVVFTNGCFDLLHKGHVAYLAKAAEMGQRLVIAVNTDASVRRQEKGPERPINEEQARCFVLAALGFVDLVVLFDGDTPLSEIQTLLPDVLVKGADYNPAQTDPSQKDYMVGSDVVRAHGGSVSVVELEDGFSTTAIVRKLAK